MNAIIDCSQNKYIDKRPAGLRIQIGDSGDLNKDSLLATNIEILKSCGIDDIYCVINCKFRPIFDYQVTPIFIDNNYGICDSIYKARQYIEDSIILQGNYLTNTDILNELKDKDLTSDILYPTSNNENDFLGLYRINKSFKQLLESYHAKYYNGKEYNFSVVDLDHDFTLLNLFYASSINKQFYKTSFNQIKYQ